LISRFYARNISGAQQISTLARQLYPCSCELNPDFRQLYPYFCHLQPDKRRYLPNKRQIRQQTPKHTHQTPISSLISTPSPIKPPSEPIKSAGLGIKMAIAP
jgi:hypothetical protein